MKFALLAVLLSQSLGGSDAQGSQARLGGHSPNADLEAQTHQKWMEELEKDGFDGVITIYNENKWPPSKSVVKSKVVAPLNVCLSANFTLESNVMIEDPGFCPGGRSPYLALYPSQDCTGIHSHPPWYDPWQGMLRSRLLSKAVWNQLSISPPDGQWSMILRCMDKDEVKTAQGADEIQSIAQPIAPPPVKKPKKELKTTTVSDSACYVKGVHPKFLFQHPKPDICLNIAPKLKLKIYDVATCENGELARFARYKNKGCKGAIQEISEVPDELLKTCIDMGDEEWSSYAFICTGNVTQEDIPYDLFPEKNDGTKMRIHYSYGGRGSQTKTSEPKPKPSGSKGSGWAVFGIIGFFILIVILIILLRFMAFLTAITQAFNWLVNLFNRDGGEGRIAL